MPSRLFLTSPPGQEMCGDVVPFTYAYPRPAVTCDAVVFTMRSDDLAILLIQRKDEPFKGRWALPGGFVNENESLERAAARELAEETGISGAKLEQLGAWGDPGRDPRGHTITIAWMTFLVAEPTVSAGDDAEAVEWHSFRTLALDDVGASRSIPPPAIRKQTTKRPARSSSRTNGTPVRLAFDHAKIISRAYATLCRHLDDPLRARKFDLLPSRFTLAELRRFYEVVLGRSLTQRSFNKRLFTQELVVPAASRPTKKPAEQLYRWNRAIG
jgi:8-oxo-dGTP diphosphatase